MGNFTITEEILNTRTNTWIYILCDVDATSESGQFESLLL